MQTVTELAALKRAVEALRARGGTVALVPTMGALHAGHMALVDRARALADHVVVSIFVNPTQFGAGEDLDAYPRPFADDQRVLAEADVALLWAPTPAVMYPDGFATSVRVEGLREPLCGASRPSHFNGVATVVVKLLNQVRPQLALFGEKDWQQLAVIRRAVADLNITVDVAGVETVREADGLAMSSRNRYLSADERETAALLPSAMTEAIGAIGGGAEVREALDRARRRLEAGGMEVEYLELRDGDTLAERDRAEPGARLFAAVRVGTTRLIDNRALADKAGAR